MEGRTLTFFILSPHPPDPPAMSETVEDSFNAPDNLCGCLRTMEIKQLSVGKGPVSGQ